MAAVACIYLYLVKEPTLSNRTLIQLKLQLSFFVTQL